MEHSIGPKRGKTHKIGDFLAYNSYIALWKYSNSAHVHEMLPMYTINLLTST